MSRHTQAISFFIIKCSWETTKFNLGVTLNGIYTKPKQAKIKTHLRKRCADTQYQI
jgi:hypothetical protein